MTQNPEPRRAPDPSGRRPLLPWWGHLVVGLMTCGLWLVLGPAIYWLRRGAVRPALIWSGVWAILIAFTAFNGGSDDRVATVAATSSSTTAEPVVTTAPSPRALVAAPPPTRHSTRAATHRATTAHRVTTSAKRTTTTSRTAKARRTTTKPPAEPETDPRFGTCREAKSHGYGPYSAGQVEYSWYRDADHDDLVCE